MVFKYSNVFTYEKDNAYAVSRKNQDHIYGL